MPLAEDWDSKGQHILQQSWSHESFVNLSSCIAQSCVTLANILSSILYISICMYLFLHDHAESTILASHQWSHDSGAREVQTHVAQTDGLCARISGSFRTNVMIWYCILSCSTSGKPGVQVIFWLSLWYFRLIYLEIHWRFLMPNSCSQDELKYVGWAPCVVENSQGHADCMDEAPENSASRIAILEWLFPGHARDWTEFLQNRLQCPAAQTEPP